MNHLTFRVIQSCLLSPSSNGSEAPSPAPPPPQFARCASSSGPPPPLSRGRKARAFSFPRRTRVRVLQTKATKLLPPKNKGRRSAEKARLSRGASPRSGCCHPSALRAGPRVQRNALAFRRSTAVLTAAPKRRSSVQAALHAMQCAGVTCALASRLSEAPRAPVVMPAGSMPGPPGSRSDELPPAGTAPTPSVGVTG
jgi:hypothetical protein